MKTIHYPYKIRSHLVTIVPMAPLTPKSTSNLRSALYFRYSIVIPCFIPRSPQIILNPNNHYVVVVYPLLPAYWGGGGESVSVPLWGFAASSSRQSSSRAAMPEGSLHKSRADSVVCICGQLKKC